MTTFNLDPEELQQFPDRMFRRLLRLPANLRETMQDLDPQMSAKLDFEQMRLWQREHIFDDWRKMERDLPILVPYLDKPNENLLICLLLEHQSNPDRLMPLRMLLYGCFFWESEWKAWEADESASDPLQLTAIQPVVFYTGLTPWKSNRTLGDLIRGPGELKQSAPLWPIKFWDVTERTSEQLLAKPSPWLNAMAVIRATNDAPDGFCAVFGEAVRCLSESTHQTGMRWRDLMWMLISWAIRRRPFDERDKLVDIAMERQSDPEFQKEIQTMSSALGPTLEELAEDRGLRKGSLRTCRELLVGVLEDHLGQVPSEVRQRIDHAGDLDKLRAAVRKAHSLESFDQLDL